MKNFRPGKTVLTPQNCMEMQKAPLFAKPLDYYWEIIAVLYQCPRILLG